MKGRLVACIFAIVALVTGAVSCFNKGSDDNALPKTVSFNFHIRPILSDKCFKCHGPDGSQQRSWSAVRYS